MKILLISYGIIGHDGRLKELIDSSKKAGNVKVIACDLNDRNSNYFESFKIKHPRDRFSPIVYFKFILHCIKVTWKNRDYDVLFVDDFIASLAGTVIYYLFRPKLLVQDSRELYVDYKMPGLGRVFCWFERFLYKRSDVIICANEQRAKIMKNAYRLEKDPYVFENIRILNEEFDEKILNEKYSDILRSTPRIISTGGCSIARGTDKLVLAMKELQECTLYIIGKGYKDDFEKIKEIIKNNDINNVIILDRVSLAELRYLIKKCDIGIVEYHKNNLNNIYCASGKVYEYMAEGVPIVTTENVPLKELCEKNNVGVADDTFVKGIKKVLSDIENYRKSVKSFMENISVEKNNENLANKLITEFDRISNHTGS